MAGLKTRKLPFGLTAVECGPGCWEWEDGGWLWRWSRQNGGVLSVAKPGDPFRIVFVGLSLTHAVVFSEGFAIGWWRSEDGWSGRRVQEGG